MSTTGSCIGWPLRLAADDVALLDRRRAVGDQARLGGGAAHVEADGALDAEQRRQPAGADHAGDRAGFHHRDRLLLRESHRHHAAVRAHDVDLAAEPLGSRRRPFEPAEIALHARTDEGVERGGRGALVFAILAHDLVRQRDEQLRVRGAQDFADAALMRGLA